MCVTPPAVSQDIFSLGAVLYELLTDTRLRDNRAATKLLLGLAATHDSPPSPSELNRRVDRDLDAICLKSLANDPERRYPTANALLKELELDFDPKVRQRGRSYFKTDRVHISATKLDGIRAFVDGSGGAEQKAHQHRARRRHEPLVNPPGQEAVRQLRDGREGCGHEFGER
jgi:serine/threonine protein kinase